MHKIYIRFMIYALQAIGLVRPTISRDLGLVECSHFDEAILPLLVQQQLHNARKCSILHSELLTQTDGPYRGHITFFEKLLIYLRNQLNLSEFHILS